MIFPSDLYVESFLIGAICAIDSTRLPGARALYHVRDVPYRTYQTITCTVVRGIYSSAYGYLLPGTCSKTQGYPHSFFLPLFSPFLPRPAALVITFYP